MMFPLRALVICYIIAVHADGDESKNKARVQSITYNDNSKLPKIHIVVRTYRKAEVVQDDAQQQDVKLGDSSDDLPIDITDREEMINEKAREHDSSLSVNLDRAKFNKPENSENNDKAATNGASLLTQSFERISNMATLAWDYVTHTEKQTHPPTARDDLSGSEDFKEVPESPKTVQLDDEKGANDVYFEEDNLQSTEEVSHVFLEENSIDQNNHTFLNHTKSLDKVNNGTINDDGIKLDSQVHKITPTSERNITNAMVENSQLKPLQFFHPRKNFDKVQKGSNHQIHYSGKKISSTYSQLENSVNGTHKNRQGGSNETINSEENEENTLMQADQPSYLSSSIFDRSETTGNHTAKHPNTGPEDTEIDDDSGSASPVYGYVGDVLDIDRSPINARHSYWPGLRNNSQRAVAEAYLNTSSISRLIDHYDRCDTCMVNIQDTSQRCHFYTDQADEFDKLAKYYTDVLRYGCSSPDAQRRCCHGQLPITQTTLHDINKLVRSISNVLWTQCQKCPVDCTWSEWQPWSHCPLTCDRNRTSTRNRTRTQIAQRYGGQFCSGSDVDLDTCNYERGAWLSWSAWSECSSTCGGTKHRTRKCSQPSTYSCFVPCADSMDSSYIEVESCGNTTGCCEQGTWLSWSAWSACNSTCGGSKHRTRKCTQPSTYSCFVPCDESLHSNFEVEQCGSLDGCCYARQWSQWRAWTDCDTGEAGSRTQRQRRWRSCEANPEYIDQPMCPQPCPGPEFEVKDCCIPASWGEWSDWGYCIGVATVVDLETGEQCGNGCKNRTRECHPGTCPNGTCYGDHIDRMFCSLAPCCESPIWSQWCPWSGCSVTIGKGIKRRTRVCQADPDKWRSPTCKAGGCYGQPDTSEVEVCKMEDCAQPSWGSWGHWSECDFNRLNPSRTKTRHCIKNSDPACRHLECRGERVLEEPCACPQPSWDNWGQWSDCDFRQPNPRRTQTRRCNKSWFLACQHLDCAGESERHERCVCEPPYWESWSQWGACDQSSNPSVRQRHRLCRQGNNPKYCPQENCVGDSVERERCCERPYWESWSQWGACDQSSNPPVRQRHRLCRQPNNPQYCPQETCFGDTVERERCCVRQEWSLWGEWSQCDTRKNPPVRTRVRQCQRPDPGCPDVTCIGPDRETIECPVLPCDPGFWSSWGPWSGCDCMVTKTKSRRRSKNSQIAGRPVCPPSSDTQRIPCDSECPDCQDTCTGRKDGEYPSCRRGCRHFVTCCEGVPLLNECNGLQQYDSTCRKCMRIPCQTCPDGQYDIYKNTPAIPYKSPEECRN